MDLAKFIHKRIQNIGWRSRGELFRKLTSDTLRSWIREFKYREKENE
tara:strand:- start:77 stop:217 length:141 start_codon:yes stop_codon:yes gene_type:complete